MWEMNSVTALLMIGPGGPGRIERRVAASRWAAAADAVATLKRIPAVDRIVVALPEAERLHLPFANDERLIWDYDPPGQPFHFGNRVAEIIQRHRASRMIYLGAGSMPLLPAPDLAEAISHVASSLGRVAVANNVHSADWVAFSHAGSVTEITHWLDRDNMLAWRLRESAGYEVTSLPPSAATRLDIDTPFDLQVLALHPRAPPTLRGQLDDIGPELNLHQLRRTVEILRTPGSRVTLIGRVPSAAGQLLESRSRCWTRVLSEERGMAANRRQAAGQVFSIVADHIGRAGEVEFVSQLAQTSDVVLWDTRVYLAHHHCWPPAEERFASDLGRLELIYDERLSRLTEAVMAAPIPIILGGHNVVSGGLYALMEITES